MQRNMIRVCLEPDLEREVWHLNSYQRRALARRFYRWSKQLWVSATILDRDAEPKPPRSLRPIGQRRQLLN